MRPFPGGSLVAKLFLIFSGAGLVIAAGALAVWLLSTSSPNVSISVDHLQRYVTLLTLEIGSPPNLEKAQSLAAETGLHIAVVGPGVEWASRPGFLARAKMVPADQRFFRPVLREPGDFIMVGQAGAFRCFFSEFPSDHKISLTLMVLAGAVVLAALVLSFVLVHLLLRPLRAMNTVARDLGAGGWKSRVSARGTDEIGMLGRTLNSMADQIEAYILSMHDLLAAVSHEIRSPLTRMKLSLEFIDNQRVKESLAEEIQILDKLTGTVLEQKRLAQPGVLHREPVALRPWVERVCAPYQKAGQPVRLELPGEDLVFLIDGPRMELAVRNLIENALRHAPGTPVDVVLHGDPRGFGLEVRDQGAGMPETLISRIGEPFLTLDPARSGDRKGGGFGLGLSIVKAVAEAHGAKLAARNLDPRGFSVTLQFEL